MYFAIRVAVASAIMIAFYIARGFDSSLETFGVGVAAALLSQTVALLVRIRRGDPAER